MIEGCSDIRCLASYLIKKWIFSRGGRPVIYQTDEEFTLLPDAIVWRHMRYEPNAGTPIDFTWEREWRIKTNRLEFNPSVAGVIFPDWSWVSRFQHEFDSVQDLVVEEYAQMLDDQLLAEGFREHMPWQVYSLRGDYVAQKACPGHIRNP